jgi:hypothetical protein
MQDPRDVRARRTGSWKTAPVIAAWLASAYVGITPLLRPRGVYGWGHYEVRDLYLGVPLLAITLVCSILTWPPCHPRARRVSFNIAIALCATLAAVMICDLGYVLAVRQIWRGPRRSDMWLGAYDRDDLPDEDLGFVRKPGIDWSGRIVAGGRYVHYRTDENGFRNPPGIHNADIVFIGDSFTEAGPLAEEDTFVRRVGATSGLQTVNLGRSCYGPQQELTVLEKFGLSYRPRAVVWVLFEGNDLFDAHRFAEWKRDPTKTQTLAARYADNSPIVKLVKLTARKSVDTPRRLLLPDERTQAVYLDYRYVPDEPARDPLGFSETQKALQTGAELCRSRGIKLLIMLVPIKARVLAPWIVFDGEGDRDQFLPDGNDQDPRDFAHAVSDTGRQLGVPVIDTFPLLRRRAAADDRFVYATYADSHLEVDGHGVLADAVLNWLASETLYDHDPHTPLAPTLAVSESGHRHSEE